MSSGIRILKTQVACLESDDEYAIECPNCHTRYVPLDPITSLSMQLPKGTMFGARCPECNHGVFFRQLNEPEALDE